jgi:hypothetical protein
MVYNDENHPIYPSCSPAKTTLYWSPRFLHDPTSIGDLDTQDPHVFGLRIWIHKTAVQIRLRIRILPFSHKDVEWTEIMLAKF